MLRSPSIVARGISPCRAPGGQIGAVVTEDTRTACRPSLPVELTTFKRKSWPLFRALRAVSMAVRS